MGSDESRNRIERELGAVMDRLRQLGGAIVIEEFPGAADDSGPSADLLDWAQVSEERERCLATRSLLIERANRLAEALEGLREGRYGTCEECGEPIAAARLKAMPEVTTCVRCQDRVERTARVQVHHDEGVRMAQKNGNGRHRRRRVLAY